MKKKKFKPMKEVWNIVKSEISDREKIRKIIEVLMKIVEKKNEIK